VNSNREPILVKRKGDYLIFEAESRPLRVVLAHGAGAPMDSPFMIEIASQIAGSGFEVVLFEFDYMKRRRLEGRKFPPNPAPRLIDRWLGVIKDLADKPLVIGGKSMGGRIASMVLADNPVLAQGLVCLGYPFHPPGRPENLRVAHLHNLQTRTLICQGERDALGNKSEIQDMRLSKAITFHWLPDGDHSFKPRIASGHTEKENITSAANRISMFLKNL